jgi:hypothetical protein
MTKGVIDLTLLVELDDIFAIRGIYIKISGGDQF